ncbi:MAG: ATP phosphoribosyltransferase, partial [Flavobacteriales bacterium]|nr:ATP phosphoribosyltransferase [Flavobacteriales bacterium]
PQYLEDGVVDCAIIGENTLIEENSTASLVEKLGFSKCHLSIAVPKTSKVSSLADLDGMRIATSYSNTLSKFMAAAHIEAKTHHISGS